MPRLSPDTLESWALRMQADFFRLRIGDHSSQLRDFMPTRAFEAAAPDALPTATLARELADLEQIRLAAFDPLRASAGLPWVMPNPALPDAGDWDPAALNSLASAAADRMEAWRATAEWSLSAAADRSFNLTLPAVDSVRLPETLAPPDWTGWRVAADGSLQAGTDRLHAWLQNPATATQIDRWRTQVDNLFGRVESLQAAAGPAAERLHSDLDRLVERLNLEGVELPAPLTARLAGLPTAGQAQRQLDAAFDRLAAGLHDPRTAAALDRLRQLRAQLNAADPAALLTDLDRQLTAWQLQYGAAADRLQAQLPTEAVAVGDWQVRIDSATATAAAALASDGSLNLRLQLAGGEWLDAALTQVSNTALPTLTASSDLAKLAKLGELGELGDLGDLGALSTSAVHRLRDGLAGGAGSLQLAVDRLQVQSNYVAADRIEFGLPGVDFRLQRGFFGQAGNGFGGRDSYLALGAADLTLAGGDYVRFQDFRFQLRTASDFFQASASVQDLQLRLHRRNWRFDAAHFALQGAGDNLQLRGIVYPHDDRGRQTAGIYFELATRDLQAAGVWAQARAAIEAQNFGALVDLFSHRPKLLSNDFLVVFNGRAARLLESQWSGRLDGGTRLLIDALSGFDDGHRTIGLRGAQVARMRELATGRQYATLVESAREVIPEIDLLYSHYLRRFGGRPDCMVEPVPVLRLGFLDGVVGVAEGSYATQYFGGLGWQLPGSGSVYSHRVLGGWLYEQTGVGAARPGDPTVLYPQYGYERAGFLQYRYNGWALAYEGRVRPTLQLAPGRRLVFGTLLNLGVRQADDLSFANENNFAKPQELLGRYDQPSPIGNLFPIFHAESSLQVEFNSLAHPGTAASVGVACDADFGYGKVARGLGLQLPLAPELTPKAFVTIARPRYRIQFLGALPTAADQVPYAACQLTWDLNRLSLEW